MHDFLKEWGPAVVTALVILILIAMIKAVAPMIKSGVLGTLTKWSGIVDSMTNNNGEFPEEKEYGADITFGTYISNFPELMINPEMKTSGDITIPGEVKLAEDNRWSEYDGKWHKITKIGNGPFYDNIYHDITSVTIEDGIEEIGFNAFNNSRIFSSLKSVTMADSVKKIGDTAFSLTSDSYSKLASVKLSNNLEYIGSQAFSHAGLKTITIPASVKTMDSQTFYASALENVVFEGATNVPYGCFDYCRNLKSVTLGEGTVEIGDYAFNQCTNLETINIPNSITSIKSNAFDGTAIQSFLYPDNITNPNVAFSGCDKLTYIKLPDNMEVFSNILYCNNLSSIEYKGVVYTTNSELRNALESNGVTININPTEKLIYYMAD